MNWDTHTFKSTMFSIYCRYSTWTTCIKAQARTPQKINTSSENTILISCFARFFRREGPYISVVRWSRPQLQYANNRFSRILRRSTFVTYTKRMPSIGFHSKRLWVKHRQRSTLIWYIFSPVVYTHMLSAGIDTIFASDSCALYSGRLFNNGKLLHIQ